ncbi:MAG TPA: hypothetical protein VF575_04025 [Candidatus Saccharimonadales bacterium]|jgi:hypothetical protein
MNEHIPTLRQQSERSSVQTDNERRFLRTLDDLAQSPPLDDEYYASFARGLRDAYLEPDGNVRSMMDQAMSQLDSSTSHRIKQALAVLQYPRYEDPDYPYSYDKPERWSGVITEIAADPVKRKEFIDDYVGQPLDSIVVGRYKAVCLAAAVYGERFGEAPTLIDYGTSIGIGVKQLAMRMEFSRLKKISFEDTSLTERDKALVESQIHIATSTNPGRKFGRILGVDIQPEPTPERSHRTRSNSHYPIELRNPANLERFDTSMTAETNDVEFAWNIDMAAAEVRLPYIPNGGFDLGFGSTWWYPYKNKPEMLKWILHNCLQPLAPNGVLLEQEFGTPDPSRPGGIYFRDNWHPPDEPYPYQTMAYDKKCPEKGFQTLFSWTDGRATNIRVSRYASALLLENI